ncbi:MAG: porin family protein [Devosia sp.]|uniref:outer membrane protein n=1 Tax=Devosia sp. TaxID=1871048 RepID=UPI001AC9400C|nr:outer membrane beta-barrel protein [Devosia sp.]MBN9310535.1 porin family protein [Devosia sp.]MBN9317342.1 porin family protein [Devosia sp.]
MKSLTVALLVGIVATQYASSSLSADLIMDKPKEVGIVDVSRDWSGPFIGVFGGWSAGSYWETGGSIYTTDFSGGLLGAVVGANLVVTDGVVAGVVGDVAWTDAGFEVGTASFDVDWTGSLRGRLGFDGGAFLPYLTAGLAVAGATADSVYGPSANTHVGWTAGAGLEYAATENLSVDLLYRYSDYGPRPYYPDDDPVSPYDAAFTTHQISVGLNWRL